MIVVNETRSRETTTKEQLQDQIQKMLNIDLYCI